MTRLHILLSATALVLIAALFWTLLYQPQRERLDEVEALIAAEQAVQSDIELEIARLQAVRERAPEVEADLAASAAIVPEDVALPSVLRQLQLAGDEAGVVLSAVSAGQPTPIEGDTAGLASLSVNLQLSGTYFQVVDFLRRVEDPAITPRGIEWQNLAIAKGTYPELTVSLDGATYALVAALPAEATPPPDTDAAEEGTEEPADAEGEGGEDLTETSDDVDVEVEG